MQGLHLLQRQHQNHYQSLVRHRIVLNQQIGIHRRKLLRLYRHPLQRLSSQMIYRHAVRRVIVLLLNLLFLSLRQLTPIRFSQYLRLLVSSHVNH